MLRAEQAERRSNELDRRVRALEATIESMRRTGDTSPGAPFTRTRRSAEPPLDPQVEAELVRLLTMRRWYGARALEIFHVTGWRRPMNLKSKLPPIAARHGKRAEQVGRGRWRFVDL